MADVFPLKSPAAAPSDDELIVRFQNGESSAFDGIVARNQERVTRLVYRLSGWSEDVEDLVQDVFVRVLQNLHRFRGESRFSTWLTAIAVNRCRSWRRRRRLRSRKLLHLWSRSKGVNPAPRRNETYEMHEQVREAVQRLPARYREPVVLRYFEDLPIQEVARVLNLSPGAVEVRLSRARRRLKELLPLPKGVEIDR